MGNIKWKDKTPEEREKRKKQQREWRSANLDKIKITTNIYHNINKRKLKAATIKRQLDNLEKYLYKKAKARSKKQNVPFTIKIEDIIIPVFCPALGLLLCSNIGEGARGGKNYASPSLDKIIPALGYTPDNSVVVSNRANTIKSDATAEELFLLAKFYSTPETQKMAREWISTLDREVSRSNIRCGE